MKTSLNKFVCIEYLQWFDPSKIRVVAFSAFRDEKKNKAINIKMHNILRQRIQCFRWNLRWDLRKCSYDSYDTTHKTSPTSVAHKKTVYQRTMSPITLQYFWNIGKTVSSSTTTFACFLVRTAHCRKIHKPKGIRWYLLAKNVMHFKIQNELI